MTAVLFSCSPGGTVAARIPVPACLLEQGAYERPDEGQVPVRSSPVGAMNGTRRFHSGLDPWKAHMRGIFPIQHISLGAMLWLAACTPRVELAAPKEPITINLNVKIEKKTWKACCPWHADATVASLSRASRLTGFRVDSPPWLAAFPLGRSRPSRRSPPSTNPLRAFEL